MKKREFLQNCWIHYSQRLPEDDQERRKLIVVWNYKLEKPWVMFSFAARRDYQKRLKDPSWPGNSPNIGLYHDHWMDLPGPLKENKG